MAGSDLAALLAGRIAARAAERTQIVVGLTGPQGSGKTTIAGELPGLLGARGLRAAVLALDDLYLPKVDRQRLAAEVHPLFATRGVPGTHDIGLGLEVLEGLQQGAPTRVPSFDKAVDDRRAPDAWAVMADPVDVIVFEGWCVGARPQSPEELVQPVNDLERERDPDATWRRHSNQVLAGDYQRLFGRIDLQILMLPPNFDVVLAWRLQQERELRARTGLGQTDAGIDQGAYAL